MRYAITTDDRPVRVRSIGIRTALRKAMKVMRGRPGDYASTDALIEALLVRGGRVTIVVEHDADDARADVTQVTALPTPTPEVES